MLVNPVFLWQNLGLVVALSLLIILGKLIITLFLGTLFPHPAQTFIVIAIGLSQIGEFSFILGQEGVLLNYLSADQYSLILAGSIISIALNPSCTGWSPYLTSGCGMYPFYGSVLTVMTFDDSS
jgi:CPA2 family monovalent cation:H+ antiporter-2